MLLPKRKNLKGLLWLAKMKPRRKKALESSTNTLLVFCLAEQSLDIRIWDSTIFRGKSFGCTRTKFWQFEIRKQWIAVEQHVSYFRWRFWPCTHFLCLNTIWSQIKELICAAETDFTSFGLDFESLPDVRADFVQQLNRLITEWNASWKEWGR